MDQLDNDFDFKKLINLYHKYHDNLKTCEEDGETEYIALEVELEDADYGAVACAQQDDDVNGTNQNGANSHNISKQNNGKKSTDAIKGNQIEAVASRSDNRKKQ